MYISRKEEFCMYMALRFPNNCEGFWCLPFGFDVSLSQFCTDFVS